MEHLSVADVMRERIIDGDWPLGHKILPPEDLALIFDVGQQTIRDAVTHLRQQGYLESRPKKTGAYVVRSLPRPAQ